MNKGSSLNTHLNSGVKYAFRQPVSLQYDWEEDTEWDIREEILKEGVSSKTYKCMSMWSMKIHSSPFDSKTSKKNSKSALQTSVDVQWNTITMENGKKEFSNADLLVRDISKSTDLEQTNIIQHNFKLIVMKEEADELLQLPLIERKIPENVNKAVKSMCNCNKNNFITMKDVQWAHDKE